MVDSQKPARQASIDQNFRPRASGDGMPSAAGPAPAVASFGPPAGARSGAPPAFPGAQFDYRWRWPAMWVLLCACFLGALDVSVVNVALIPIRTDLGATERQITWMVAGYILAFALALLPFGRLGDVVGRKRMFLGGAVGFTAASLMCGTASSPDLLIVGRVLQGMTAAILTPQATAIAQSMFAPRERASAFALFGVVTSLAELLGPVISGALTKVDLFGLGWRPIFMINVPICLALIICAALVVPKVKTPPTGGLDVVAVLIASAAVLCMAFPLIEGQNHGWSLWRAGMMAGAIPLTGALIAWESRRARRGHSVLLPAYLARSRDYVLGAFVLALLFSALLGFFFTFVISLQEGFHYSPLLSGIAGAPFSIGVLVASLAGTRLKSLRTRILLGLSMLIFNGLALWVIVERAADALSPFVLTVPLLIGGIGCGLAVGALFQTVLRTVAMADAGAGAGALQAIQQVGAMLGVALVSSLFFSGLGPVHGTGAAARVAVQKALIGPFAYYTVGFLLAALLSLGLEFRRPVMSMPTAEAPPVKSNARAVAVTASSE